MHVTQRSGDDVSARAVNPGAAGRLGRAYELGHASEFAGSRRALATFAEKPGGKPQDAAGSREAGSVAHGPPGQPRKSQPSVVSLLIGAVLTLWLLLFLSGHW
jgi:hypothetical protein